MTGSLSSARQRTPLGALYVPQTHCASCRPAKIANAPKPERTFKFLSPHNEASPLVAYRLTESSNDEAPTQPMRAHSTGLEIYPRTLSWWNTFVLAVTVRWQCFALFRNKSQYGHSSKHGASKSNSSKPLLRTLCAATPSKLSFQSF